MSLALLAMSHTPLMGKHEPADNVVAEVDAALTAARRFVEDFDPDLVVIFAPDHYNGLLYDLMPPFVIGMAATSVGDYSTIKGPLSVDRQAAASIVETVLAADIDVAFSERMVVDHGVAQPLGIIFGSLDAVPTVPMIINSVAVPLGPVRRSRLLGEAVGQALGQLDRRVLLLASGGLSHDPPVPTLAGAAPDVAERLIAGRHRSSDQRSEHEQRVVAAARDFVAGNSTIQPLNPGWDRQVMSLLAEGDLDEIDTWSTEFFLEQGGHSSHEVRTWIAAFAALDANGRHEVVSSYYRAIPEWIAGFGIICAKSELLPEHAS